MNLNDETQPDKVPSANFLGQFKHIHQWLKILKLILFSLDDRSGSLSKDHVQHPDNGPVSLLSLFVSVRALSFIISENLCNRNLVTVSG